jgi:heme/copper-type cytochrome/quinol oxidase subunit 1
MPRSRVVLLSWVVAITFLLAVVLQLVDRLNLFVTPPDISASANMVDRALTLAPYRQAVWPLFLWMNLLFAIGFAALVVFGRALAAQAGNRALATFGSLVTVGGIVGVVTSVIPIGAVDSSVWLQYCDCGFKDTEIVSQQWATTIAMDIANWLLRVVGVTLAIALVDFVRSGTTAVPAALRTWSYLTALVLVVAPVLGVIARFDDIPDWLTALAAGVLVPVWAVWAGRSMTVAPETAPPA